MKVAGGTRRLSSELSIDAFIEQADNFGKLQDEGPLGRYIAIFQTLFRSHPFPIWRTKEVLDWVTTGNFMEILDGDYRTRTLAVTRPCPKCSTEVKLDAVVCHNCGASVHPDAPDDGEDEDLDDESTDPVSGAWKNVRGWYKRNFTVDDDEEVEGKPKRADVIDVDSEEIPPDESDDEDKPPAS
jgi:hypothetical protein